MTMLDRERSSQMCRNIQDVPYELTKLTPAVISFGLHLFFHGKVNGGGSEYCELVKYSMEFCHLQFQTELSM